MESSKRVVELRDVWAGYKEIRGFKSFLKHYYVVLRNINLEIFEGERVAVIGESGSGKSTLLKVILGLLKPIKGVVRVGDVEIYKLPWRKRVKVTMKIGYVPQDPYKALNPLLKVKQILAEPLEAMGDKEAVEKRVREVVKLVGLPSHVLDLTPNELSGGMRQRVLIARAIVHKPLILLLDEPTSALDVSIQAQIINLLNDIYSKLRTTMVIVTHDLAIAQYLADRVVILKEGIIVEEGPWERILNSPLNEFTKALLSNYYV